jgi:hypothetical protein
MTKGSLPGKVLFSELPGGRPLDGEGFVPARRCHSVAAAYLRLAGLDGIIFFKFDGLDNNRDEFHPWQNACFTVARTGYPFANVDEEKELTLSGNIRWETDLKKALNRAGSDGKSVLLFFHNPG